MTDDHFCNVFVPTFAPQYSDMVARGGRPGVSLEDQHRHGVWVPLSWLQSQYGATRQAWTRFTDNELRAIYPSKFQAENNDGGTQTQGD